MILRTRTLSLIASVLFTLQINACSSQEAGTEESIQPTEEQAPAEASDKPAEANADKPAGEPTEKDKALADATSNDFTEPTDVQLSGEAAPAAVADAPVVAPADSETPTPVDAVDNAPVAAPAVPDLTSDSSLSTPSASGSAVFFGKSSARITKEYRVQLKEIASKLKSDRAAKISLTAHCDNRGSAAFNRRLANKRARAVKAALVKMGVKAKQIQIGAAQLASSGSTEEEHAQNRRVEVEFQ